MSRLTLITYRLASRLRSTPQSLPSRLFAQQAAVRTARATPSQAWFERVARAPSAHRQSSRWRPLGAAASNAHAAHMPHAEAEATGEAAASGASSSSSSSSSDARMRLLISYHDLERALERRGVNKARAALAAFAGLVVAVGLMWPRIKQWGAVEGAEVAAASLEHEQLQTKAMAMVREVLTDPRTALQVEALLNVAVTNLLNDAEFTEWAVDWTARVLSDALMRDALVQYGTQYVVNVLSHDDCLQDVQRFLSNAVNRAVDDETLQDKVASGLWSGIRASVMGRKPPITAIKAHPEQAAEKVADATAATNATSTETGKSIADTSAASLQSEPRNFSLPK